MLSVRMQRHFVQSSGKTFLSWNLVSFGLIGSTYLSFHMGNYYGYKSIDNRKVVTCVGFHIALL
jgi:hypothetical protein